MPHLPSPPLQVEPSCLPGSLGCGRTRCQPALRLLAKEVLPARQDSGCAEGQLALDRPPNSHRRSARHEQFSEHTTLKLVLLESTWSQMTSIPETPHLQQITEPCRESFLSVTVANRVITVTAAFISVLVHGIICIRILEMHETLLSCLQSNTEELSQPEGLI